jgi:glucose/arabinose dehydrogenase
MNLDSPSGPMTGASRTTRSIRAALTGALALFVLSTSVALAAPAPPAPAGDPAPPAYTAAAVNLGLSQVVTGLSRPVALTAAGDGSGRLFVVEQAGSIRIIKGGTLLATPFLDIHTKVSCCGERGLLGLAFHPSFATNRRFYVFYTRLDGDLVISQFSATSADPDRASTSEKVILRIEHSRYANHNGGQLVFGPDGYLYIGTGDGGGSGDPLRSGQSRTTRLGKILRIDINRTTATRNYAIPSTNPYATSTTRKREIWSYGLRNPWRFSFDRATGDLYVGDVGQGRYEEIDRARRRTGGGRGVNWGWSVMEGNHCYRPSTGCNTTGKARPVAEYRHAVPGVNNCSVTGGYVYRGAAFPDMVGGYFFGDFCSGRIWSFSAAAAGAQNEVLALDSSAAISAFGQDDAGELYLADYSGGTIYRLVDQG